MHILHILDNLSIRGAGVFHFLRGSAIAQLENGIEVVVVGISDLSDPDIQKQWAPVPIIALKASGPRGMRVVDGLEKIIATQHPDLIHCHGLWAFHDRTVPPLSRRLGIPYVVSPHGMLETWAWNYHWWKKRPVWWLWERRFLQSASLLVGTASSEIQSFRQRGLGRPSAMIPIGVFVPDGIPSSLNQEYKIKTVLFLSRIHFKKGLLNLVEAWQQLNVSLTEWRVVVAGPDEGGHLAVVQEAIKKAGLEVVFSFIGAVEGNEKWKTYQKADLFVLPTYSENFGIVIAEALACGVPVITTKGTPWEELQSHKCGWWIDIGVDPLVKALREAMSLSDVQRYEMGQRGRELMVQKYSWPKIAQQMAAVYEWVLGKGSIPNCVSLK
jgi:glycosyltransferase involved in cell wall biosynthesis